MSRIGKLPVAIPAGVHVTIKDAVVTVKGPKGELKRGVPSGVSAKLEAGKLLVSRAGDGREERSRHGLLRALLANMVKGVSEGYTRQLEINGVGYRAEVVGTKLSLVVGLSHPVEMLLPPGVSAKSEKAKSTVNAGQDAVLLTLMGHDKEVIGQLASKIRSTRPPEPYKGKGIKYFEEKLKRKVGKTGAS
ncbi:MAG TPA: 50S ribosomal protein L6 [Pseudomonadota bacterium]|jgi:large subunit ribosomal protein L6|nr:50S ribosomal protein L6 [Pseudomonadota bacterium]